MEKSKVFIRSMSGYKLIDQTSIISITMTAEPRDHRVMIETPEKVYIFPLNQCFEIHICNEFFRSLDLNNHFEIKFERYSQYEILISKINDYLIKQG